MLLAIQSGKLALGLSVYSKSCFSSFFLITAHNSLIKRAPQFVFCEAF